MFVTWVSCWSTIFTNVEFVNVSFLSRVTDTLIIIVVFPDMFSVNADKIYSEFLLLTLKLDMDSNLSLLSFDTCWADQE